MVFRCKILMAAGNDLANYRELRGMSIEEGVRMMFALDAINQTVGKM